MDSTACATISEMMPHEIAHAMVNTIMTKIDGKFNGVDFKEMTKQELDSMVGL